MKTESILEVAHLSTLLRLGSQLYPVVNQLSFHLYKGKTLAIVGESGSGKTMTALSIMRITPEPPALPSTGKVIYKGRNLLEISEKEMRKVRGAKIAMIFQDPLSALNPVYAIGDQLMEVVNLHLNMYGNAAIERIITALDAVGISSPHERLLDYPHQLSGGMKQRVMIAMALLCEPDILIADEPTTALDVTVQAQVLDLMRDLQKKMGMAILLITHDMGVVAEMADDVIVMYATEAVEKGGVNQVFDHIAHPYSQGLFQSLPSEHEPHTKLQVIQGTIPSIKNLPTGCLFHPRCPYVMDICKTGEVPWFTVKDQNHQAKCWLYRPLT